MHSCCAFPIPCHLTAAFFLVQIQPHLDVHFDTMSYKPTIFFNEFWQMRDNLIPVNSTLQEQVIALDLSQMGLWKFTIYLQVEKSFEMQVRGKLPCQHGGAQTLLVAGMASRGACVMPCMLRCMQQTSGRLGSSEERTVFEALHTVFTGLYIFISWLL